MIVLRIGLVISAMTLSAWGKAADNKVIYAQDDRIELTGSHPLEQHLASSVAIKVESSFLKAVADTNGKLLSLNTKTAQEAYRLCASEPYVEQITAGECTGFLISKKHLVTAGHCMRTLQDCQQKSWIFGFNSRNDMGDGEALVQHKNVYSCRKIVKKVFNLAVENDPLKYTDYAIIELDRSVTGREPLVLSLKKQIEVNTQLVVLGHPAGLPLKIAGGGEVVDNKAVTWFRTNLDTFGGNSGSPVVARHTGEVAGVLVRGAKDYVEHPEQNCRVINRCTKQNSNNKVCKGEDVVRSFVIDIAATTHL